MTSPACTVNGFATTNGVDVAAASTPTIALADTAGVKQWALSCLNTDELNAAATVNAGLVVNDITKTATFTAPDLGSALIFESRVNNGRDVNGRPDASLTTRFGIYVLAANGLRVGAFDEVTEGNAAYGWITKINPLVRGQGVDAAGLGTQLVIRKSFAAGTPGTADDVTIYDANAPFSFFILDSFLVIGTAIGGSTAQLRSASGGAGSALSDAFSTATTGNKRNTAMTTTPSVSSGGSLFLRRSDRGIAGVLVASILRV